MKIKARVFSSVGLTLLFSLVLLSASLYFAHKTRSYNSDDVSWQVILRTFNPTSQDNAIALGSSNNHWSKLPFFWLTENIFDSGRKLLFLQSYVLAVSSFVLYYSSAVYFLKRLKVEMTFRNLLPIAWLGSFGFAYAELYLNPIWRGFELGLCFAMIALVAMYIRNELHPFKNLLTKSLFVIGASLLGVILFSDISLVYFFVGPLLAWVAWLRIKGVIGDKKLAGLLLFLGISYVTSKISGLIFAKQGLKMAVEYPVQFIDFGGLLNNILIGVHGILAIFGADLSGKYPFSLVAIGALVNLVLIAWLVGTILKNRASLKKSFLRPTLDSSLVAFLIALPVFVFSLYVLSTVSVNTVTTYRYLIVVALAAPILLAYYLAKRPNNIVTLLVIVSIALNLTSSVFFNSRFLVRGTIDNMVAGQQSNTENASNSLNFRIIDRLKDAGTQKAYANYWQAGINTYLSNGDVEVLPVTCEHRKTITFQWLVDSRRFSVLSDKTALILDPDVSSPAMCSYKSIVKQFGTPSRELKDGNKRILVYDYDLYSKMSR